jgi:hypothetical protein
LESSYGIENELAMMIMKTLRAKRLGVIALTFVIPEFALNGHYRSDGSVALKHGQQPERNRSLVRIDSNRAWDEQVCD